MQRIRGKAFLFSLVVGIFAACGAAFFLAIAYVIIGLWLSGHNRILFGWNGSQVTGFDWPNFVFLAGSLLAGLLTAILCYRNRRPDNQIDD